LYRRLPRLSRKVRSEKALAVATVGRHFPDDFSLRDEEELVEVLADLPIANSSFGTSPTPGLASLARLRLAWRFTEVYLRIATEVFLGFF